MLCSNLRSWRTRYMRILISIICQMYRNKLKCSTKEWLICREFSRMPCTKSAHQWSRLTSIKLSHQVINRNKNNHHLQLAKELVLLQMHLKMARETRLVVVELDKDTYHLVALLIRLQVYLRNQSVVRCCEAKYKFLSKCFWSEPKFQSLIIDSRQNSSSYSKIALEILRISRARI